MSGLMARIRSRRADGQPTTAADAEGQTLDEQPTTVVPDAAATPPPDEQATAVAPAVTEDQPAAPEPPPASPDERAPTTGPEETAAPAGAEATPSGPSFRDRGKLRRRLRYLRRVRELGFRDLGGLVFDLDRFGR